MNLQAKPYTNLDQYTTFGIAKFIDAGKDDLMNNTRRPGLGSNTANAYQIDLGELKAVDSVYEWEFQGWQVSVCNGKLFKTTKSGTTYTTTEITGATLEKGTPATFADFGTTLYMANGGKIIKWIAANSTCSYIVDSEAPTTVTHLGFIDQYLMALDGDGTIHFSEVGDPDTWEGEFFDAERLKDKTVAIHTNFGEMAAFGSLTVEYFGNTGNATAPWQRFEGKVTQRGTIALYSVIQVDNTYFMLDQERKVVRLVGSDPQVISNPFDSDFQELDTVSDARGMHILAGGDTWYVLTFPTEDKTYAYDYKRDIWSEWSYQNNTTGLREDFLGQTSCYMKSWNQHLVGTRALTGYIYLASKDIYKDGGNPCFWELWTGWEGTGDWVSVAELRLTLKRGKGSALTTPEPWLEIYYRDDTGNPNDPDSSWKGPRIVNLGQLGETDKVFRIFQMGRYRNRQYRFLCSTDVPLVLIKAEEFYG